MKYFKNLILLIFLTIVLIFLSCENDGGSNNTGTADKPGITVTPVTTTFLEDGGTGSFTVVLNEEPDGDVAINVSSSDTTEAAVNGAIDNLLTLTFTSTNWSTAQTVNLTGVNDEIADGNQEFNITVSINTGLIIDTTGYVLLNPDDVSVTVQDDYYTPKTWIQDAYLKASNAGMDDEFGISVGISGDIIAVGAGGEDSNATSIINDDGTASSNNEAEGAGAVYVYKRNILGNWIQDAYLKASNCETEDNFGCSIAVSGNIIAVGAMYENSTGTSIINDDGHPTVAESNNDSEYSGAVYVYKRDISGNWIQDAYLKASNGEAGDFFGNSVGVSGDIIAVGASSEDSNATSITNEDVDASSSNAAEHSGAVYVYKRDISGNWIQDAYLKASNCNANDFWDLFGASVGVSGDIIAVGASKEDSSATSITNDDGVASSNISAGSSGAVYVYKKDISGNWIQDAYLKASNCSAGDNFGASVGISGNIIAVGASYEYSNETSIINDDGVASLNNDVSFIGAVYVYKKDLSGNWIQDAYLKASNGEAQDHFGSKVGISRDIIAVGASNEDSNATSIINDDGHPSIAESNNDASHSGTVYVFKRDILGNWIQDAYLKASNCDEDDSFGWPVGISGNIIVVGAYHEKSNATSITNGDGHPTIAESNNNAYRSGAVYIFKAE